MNANELSLGEIEMNAFKQFLGGKVKVAFFDPMSMPVSGKLTRVEGEFLLLDNATIPGTTGIIPGVLISARSIERVYWYGDDETANG